LHRIAKNTGWQNFRQAINDGVLGKNAVLIFINKQATVGGSRSAQSVTGQQRQAETDPKRPLESALAFSPL
jgi:hypothetical protein